MRIKRKTDYAIRCVLFMSMEPDKVYTVKEISKKGKIPENFLSKILQKLNKKGIVKSIRGNKGGYILKRKPEDISLFDIVLIFEGSVAFNLCAVEKRYCSFSNICSVHPVWVKLRKEIENKLKRENFKKLAKYFKKFYN